MENAERLELIQFYKDAFASAIDGGVYDDIDEIWQELAKLEPENTPAFMAMIDELAAKRRNEQAAGLLLHLAAIYSETGNIQACEQALRRAAQLSPANAELKEQIAQLFRETHADHPLVEAAIRKAGITRPPTLDETLPRLETYLLFREGDIVNHPTGWGIGVVAEIDIEEETLTVDFQAKKGHTVSLEMAAKILQRIAPESYQGRMFNDPDALKRLAEDEPAEVIKLALEELGGKAALKELKSKLTSGAVDNASWSKWWTKAKKAAMKDPYLNVSGGAAATLELREQPVSHHEAIVESLSSARSLEKKISLIEEYTGAMKSNEIPPGVLSEITQIFAREYEKNEKPHAKVQIALILDELAELAPGEQPAPTDLDTVFTPQTAREIIEEIDKPARKRRALIKLKQMYPDQWQEFYLTLFFDGTGDLWDFAAKELLDAKKHAELAQTFTRILATAGQNLEVYLWLCRSAIMGRYPTALSEHNRVDLIEKLLQILNEMMKAEHGKDKNAAAEHKKLLAKARDTIAASDFKHIQTIIENCSTDEARRIYNAAAACRGLTETGQEKLLDIVIAEFPELAPKAAAQPAEDEHIYTTEAGLRKKEEEFQRVLNVEIPENQEALRTAISFGDLSENAEYTSAREQQGILMKKAERIEKELAKAKLIDPGTVSGDIVSMGTSIEVKKIDGARIERYTILGPWDADAEQGILSYLAPLAAAFLGKKPGDRVSFNFADRHDEYEILSVKKAV